MAEPNPLDDLAKRREKRKTTQAPSAGPGGDGSDERPVINIEGGKLPEIVDAAEDALLASSAEIYQSGGRLVAIGHADPGKRKQAISRPEGAPRLVPATAVHIREVLTAVAIWHRYDARAMAWRNVDCPMNVAAALVERGRWNLRELVAYVEAPTVREDGTPITAPGYDDATGLYLLPGAPPITVSDKPTLDDAKRAAADLLTCVDSWPYVENSDHAAAVAALMGLLYARSIDAVPMACVTAPAPGSGKSLLVDVGAIVATGRRAAVVSLGRDPAEAGKRLAAGLLTGDSPLSADNVETALGDELLCQAITITTAYRCAGFPPVDIDPLGGFGPWDTLIRRPLVWAGLPDPLGPTTEIRADDPDRMAMAAIFAAMHERYAERIVTSADIIDDAQRGAPRYDGGGFEPEYPALNDAVRHACGTRVDSRHLGAVLRRYRGRIADGLRLDGVARHGPTKVTGWQVIQIFPAPPSS